MTFAPIDAVFLLLILIFAIIACVKGFLKELCSKVSIIAGIALGILLTPKLEPFVSKVVHKEIFSKIISFLLIFILVFLLVLIVQHILLKVFSGEIMQGLDRTLGFVLGVIEGLVIIVCVLAFFKVQPWWDSASLIENSFFNKILGGLVSIPQNYMAGSNA